MTVIRPCAVLDTNAVLDWLVFRDPGVQALGAALAGGTLRWLSCPPMRDELARMLASPRLARWAPDAGAVLAVHDRLALRREPPAARPARWPRCMDADDQVFVDLALAHGADWLLSHDRALLKLARRTAPLGLRIVRPADWRTAVQ